MTDVEDDAVDSPPLADGPHQNSNGVCESTSGSGGGGEHAGSGGCASIASGASQPQSHELSTVVPSSNANHPNVPIHIAATQDHSDAGYVHEGHCNPPSHSTQASPTPLELVPNFNDTTSSLPALPTQVQSNDGYANTGLSNLQDPSDQASLLSQGSLNDANHSNSIYSALPAGTLSSGDYANPTHSGTPSHFHQASPPPYESIDPPPQNCSFLANPTNGHYENLFSVAPSSVSTAAARNYADHAGTDVGGMAVDDNVANMGSVGQVSTFEHEFSSGMQQSAFVSDHTQNSSFLNNTNHATFPYDQQPALPPFFGANQIVGDSAMDDVESCTPGLHSSQFQSFGIENVVDNVGSIPLSVIRNKFGTLIWLGLVIAVPELESRHYCWRTGIYPRLLQPGPCGRQQFHVLSVKLPIAGIIICASGPSSPAATVLRANVGSISASDCLPPGSATLLFVLPAFVSLYLNLRLPEFILWTPYPRRNSLPPPTTESFLLSSPSAVLPFTVSFYYGSVSASIW